MFPPTPLRGVTPPRLPLQDDTHTPAALPALERARARTPATGGGSSRGRYPRHLLMAAGLVTLVLVCYWPALRGEMLWDDDAHVTRPELRSWDGLIRIWTDLTATQQYYPVLHSAFWLEHRLWGDATLPYHLLNVALHALAALLLVAALQRCFESRVELGTQTSKPKTQTSKPKTQNSKPKTQNTPNPALGVGAAWLAGLLFAVHPVAVESVAWISEQKNTLSLVFYLAAGLVFLRFDRTRNPWAYGGAFGLYALALGTKSVTATLPAALLVILWWQRGNLSWRRDVLPLIPWFATGIGAGLFTAWVEYNLIGAYGDEFALTWWHRVLLAARVIAFYAGKLLWPADLMFIYPRWDVPASAVAWIGWLLAVLGVTLAFWRVRHRNRGLLAGWLFFVGSLVPALGFVNVYPFRYSYVADHFQYLPSLGVIGLMAAGLVRAWQGWIARPEPPQVNFLQPKTAGADSSAPAGRQRLGVALVGLVVAGLAVLSHQQAHQYRDVETLFRTTLARNPGCWMAHLNLGVHLAQAPATKPEAIAHFRAVLAIKPDAAEAHYNLANELTRTGGSSTEAIEHYGRAIALKPDYAAAHHNLALELQKIPGREPEAVSHFEAVLRLNPAHARAHNNLGILLTADPNRLPEAIGHFEAALQLQPDFAIARANLASAQNDLGISCAKQGRFEEAARCWRRALELDGSLVQARENLTLVQTLVKRR